MILCDLEGAMELDCSRDMSDLHQVCFQCINDSYVEVVALIRHVFSILSQKSVIGF